MKTLLSALTIAALTAGLTGLSYAAPFRYSACAHNNSEACRDARDAFAEHHNGVYPNQWYNQWYQGRQGRWAQRDKNWRWEGMDGRDYCHGPKGWEWTERSHDPHHWW